LYRILYQSGTCTDVNKEAITKHRNEREFSLQLMSLLSISDGTSEQPSSTEHQQRQ
jgi:hypothetical protein